MLQDRLRTHAVLLAGGDAALALCAYLLAFWVRASIDLPGFEHPLPPGRFGEVDHLLGLLLGSQALFLYSFGLYDDRLLRMRAGRLWRLSAAAAALQVLTLVGYRYFSSPFPHPGSALDFPRSVYLVFFPLNVAFGVLGRWLLLGHLRRSQGARLVAVVGAGPVAAELIEEIRRRPETGLQVAGVLDDALAGDPRAQYCGVPVLGPRKELVEIVRRGRISEIIVASAEEGREELLETIGRGELTGARVSLVPGFYELLIGKVHRLHVHDIPLVEVLREPTSRPYRHLKRLLDVGFAVLLGAAAAPLAALAALLVRLEDGGPVLYSQERVGEGLRPFCLYKFRTMAPDAESSTGPVLASAEDGRVTRVGRWLRRYRVDELPQLWNVLRGEMSLVGPRPERPFFVERFLAEIPGYAERFKVKPGVTGLAQVRGTYGTSAQNKLRYDLAYVYNQSVGLDLAVLADTVKEVLNSRSH
jgi:exopolysaccharide biosynthesis polyprenyl glycosylphosphotransferase